ncbi:thiol-disulfide oxidoreductase DCC family protein [Erythrobacter sp. JK5]|uniref:thiol-disulfide oxidoreductase DCC family protein n=1 Tax=Erythrobacter sp. JK5 TaxID=2829500 RepID=UPI001BABDD4F|nr:thiol-disulfide oxidoreductase DCC family protein [Erythrobacter sp. JK5]QUL37575.1 thiol-disulfide oxidoreductase DCC family protein [Erythrobacter sp. JK5]
MAIPRDHPIIVFDGMCVLCSANAQFVLKNDRTGKFRLAAMQDEAGAQILRDAGLDPADPLSFIILDAEQNGGKVRMDSDAVLHLWSELGWPWRLGAVFRLVPRFVRDSIYRLIARNRYRWFGKRETCWVPDREQASRIL